MVWDTSTRAVFRSRRYDDIAFMLFSPDSTRITAHSSMSKSLIMWHIREDSVISFSNHVIAAAFFPDATRLITVSWRGPMHIWDITSSTPSSESIFQEFQYSVSSVCLLSPMVLDCFRAMDFGILSTADILYMSIF
jgi:WD40 repeat protein